MSLITKQQFARLQANGLPNNRDKDHMPVIKLFLPGSSCTWLLSEIDYEEQDIAFGLCDLGLSFPQLGNINLSELLSVRSKFRLPVERDLYFNPNFPLSVYARAASHFQYIIEDEALLINFIE